MSLHERWRPRKVILDFSGGGEEAEAINIVAEDRIRSQTWVEFVIVLIIAIWNVIEKVFARNASSRCSRTNDASQSPNQIHELNG